MPRKNRNHADKLVFILKRHLSKNWKIKTLDNLTEAEIIKFLKKVSVYII